jgi:formate/nitrite transporter
MTKVTNEGPTGLDAYTPAEIEGRIATAGVAKAALPLVPLVTLGVLGGMFIAFGAIAFTTVTTGVDLSGPVRLLGGMAFCVGLVLVVVGGAELFTGNALIVIAWADGRVSTAGLLRNWAVVLPANMAGALAVALVMDQAGLLQGATGDRAAAIAEAKLGLGLAEAFWRGVLCNALVCLAVWLAMASRSAGGKIMAILFPITTFVAAGFEHSVANFYLIPAGLMAGASGTWADVLGNWVPVTLGNIVGGAGGVALSYRLAYGRRVEPGKAGRPPAG